jgi:predicted alpha/beta hydrolase family esterase
MKFVYFHGSFSTPHDAWVPWLQDHLIDEGHECIAPQYPVDPWTEASRIDPKDYNPTQHLERWLQVYEGVYQTINNAKDLVFIGHSLGPLFILHATKKFPISVRHAYFLCPFFEIRGKNPTVIKANESFYSREFDFEKLRQNIPHSTVIWSDDDQYVSEIAAREFSERMQSEFIKLSGFGHMGSESGIKEFPKLLRLINDNLK